jgi:alginate O-acetyltransferase complex protein AlgI
VVVGWVFFRAQTFGQAGTVLIHMFTPTDGLSLRPAAELLVVVCLSLTFLGAWIGTHMNLAGAERRIPAPVMGAALAAVILFALLLFPEDCRTFIYFQF